MRSLASAGKGHPWVLVGRVYGDGAKAKPTDWQRISGGDE